MRNEINQRRHTSTQSASPSPIFAAKENMQRLKLVGEFGAVGNHEALRG